MSNSNIPCCVIYCDESCHELTPYHAFMSIGGLKIPKDKKNMLSRELRDLKRSLNLNSELKWSKVSQKRFKDYEKIIDFFFEHPEINFRAIVIEQSKVNIEEYHGKDKELAFYKFYYEMLEKWLEAGNEYLVLLDYKNNRDSNRYKTLKIYLERYLRGKAWIKDLTVINSKETPLAQLCDIFTGAIAAANNGVKKETAKEQLVRYIETCAGKNLCQTTPIYTIPLNEQKFNIFKPNLGE